MTTTPREERLTSWMSIPIPHLRAELHLFDMSKLRGVPIRGSAYTCIYQERPDDLKLDIAIFIQDIEDTAIPENSPMIAHELVHVLQILCDERNMGITDEKEHLAFLMSYLMEKILKKVTKETLLNPQDLTSRDHANY